MDWQTSQVFHNGFMYSCLVVFLGCLLAMHARSYSAPPLETSSQPFDFDSYRRNPVDAQQTPTYSTQDGRNLQNNLISGKTKKDDDIAKQAAAMFPPIESIPLEKKPPRLPTRNELIDQISADRYPDSSSKEKNLLNRGKVARELDLSSMSDSDYEIFASQYLAKKGGTEPEQQDMTNPMPTVTNLKTDGPAHAYSVNRAGVRKPVSTDNPFENVANFFHLNDTVTHASDPLPASKPTPSRAPIITPEPTPATERPSPSAGSY